MSPLTGLNYLCSYTFSHGWLAVGHRMSPLRGSMRCRMRRLTEAADRALSWARHRQDRNLFVAMTGVKLKTKNLVRPIGAVTANLDKLGSRTAPTTRWEIGDSAAPFPTGRNLQRNLRHNLPIASKSAGISPGTGH